MADIIINRKCYKCSGIGSYTYINTDGEGNTTEILQNPCPTCNGDGKILSETAIDSTWFDDISTKVDYVYNKTDNIINKLNDIKAKCDDIWDKVK